MGEKNSRVRKENEVGIFIEDLKYAWTFLFVYNQSYSWDFWLTEVLKKNLIEKKL